MRHLKALTLTFLLFLFATSCGGSRSPTEPTSLPEKTTETPTSTNPPQEPAPPPPPQPPPPLPLPIPASDEIIVAAGDIAVCGSEGTEGTARLLDGLDGTILTLGDNVYPKASAQTFKDCYEPTWGRHKSRTRPSPGNHDWSEADGGASYFLYFGANAGPPGLGYYSFDLGAWHIVSLNSEIRMGSESAQMSWLQMDLAANQGKAIVAYWHQPLFTSGQNGPSPNMREAWRVLDAAGACVILNGHEHSYERFAPQDADGRSDPNGIREFVVGTAGARRYERRPSTGNSEVYDSSSWGVIKLQLRASRNYGWEFIPVAGHSFRDSGSGVCR